MNDLVATDGSIMLDVYQTIYQTHHQHGHPSTYTGAGTGPPSFQTSQDYYAQRNTHLRQPIQPTPLQQYALQTQGFPRPLPPRNVPRVQATAFSSPPSPPQNRPIYFPMPVMPPVANNRFNTEGAPPSHNFTQPASWPTMVCKLVNSGRCKSRKGQCHMCVNDCLQSRLFLNFSF